MNIAEMHVWFRQHAQQMGMQNVRAILPEQIDLLINTSITDTINALIQQNIGITNDRVITDNSKVGQINAFRTLYKVIEVDAEPVLNTTPSTVEKPFVLQNETFILRQSAPIKNFSEGGFDYLFLVDLSLNYHRDAWKDKYNTVTTNYFPVRLIEDAYLSDTLNDFVLRPRLRTPIAVIYNDTLDLYVDILNDGDLPESLVPYRLRVSYIAKPREVAYKQDLTGNANDNVDCDLPDYLHVDILKHAVDLYRVALSGALSSQSSQESQAQNENYRNNYRNETGYPVNTSK